ncbi:hypothetical protein [Nocardia xishanensis]
MPEYTAKFGNRFCAAIDSDLTLSRGAQHLAAAAACAALADTVLGSLSQQRCAMWADRALAELIKFDAVGGPERGDLVVRLAIQAAQSIGRSHIERKQDLIDKFGEIARRQRVSAVPEAAQIARLQELVVRGEVPPLSRRADYLFPAGTR